MKRILLAIALFAICNIVVAQKKPAKAPAQASMADVEKIMKAQGMSAEDIKMMKEVMNDPNMKKNAEKAQAKPKIKSLKDFIPKTKKAEINKVLKTDADVKSYVDDLYNKVLKNGDAAQIAAAKKAMAIAKTTTSLTDASQTAMFGGQLQTALLLSMKAQQQEFNNPVPQNNVAALLTQLGYGENALPILFKINNTIVNNSTVLNNIAFSYLDMGDLPKAYTYSRRATKVNPEHPQSRLCASALLEQAGQTQAAAEQMEIVNKHNNASVSENTTYNPYKEIKMTWQEVKLKFTAFEYIKPGWRNTYYPDIVTLDLEKYKDHMGKHFADADMRKAFGKKILEIQKPLRKFANEKYKEAEDMEGAMAMMKKMGDQETLAKSTIAFGTILNAFEQQKQNVWMHEFDKLKEAEDNIEKNKPKMEDCPHGGSHSTNAAKKACDRKRCSDYAPVIDNYRSNAMQTHNAKVIKFMEELEEEYRNFTNLALTYFIISQSTVGISKDEISITCLDFIDRFGYELFVFEFDEDEIYYRMYNYTCDSKNTNSGPQAAPEMPLIPNFDCLVIFSFPSEFNDIKISSKGINAANNYGMNLEKLMLQGNMSSAISLTDRIAEPGMNADPYTNVGNGTMQPVYGSPNNSNQYKPSENQLSNTNSAPAPLPSPKKVYSSNLSASDKQWLEFSEKYLEEFEREEKAMAKKEAQNLIDAADAKEAQDFENKTNAEQEVKALKKARESQELYDEANAAREMLKEATDMSCFNANGYNNKDKIKKIKEVQKQKADQYKRAHEAWVAQQAVFDQINRLRGDERDALIERFKEIQKSMGASENEIAKDLAEINNQFEVQTENRRQGRMKDMNNKINTIIKTINKLPTQKAANTMDHMGKTYPELFGKGFNYDAACKNLGVQPVHREYFNSEGFITSFNNGVTTENNNSLKAAGLLK